MAQSIIADYSTDSYLTISWDNAKSTISKLEFDQEKLEQNENLLDSSLSTSKSLLSLGKNISKDVSKYFARNTLDSTGYSAVNGMISILEDGKIDSEDVLNNFLKTSSGVLDKTAKAMGFSDPNVLTQQLSGVVEGLDIASFFSAFKSSATEEMEIEEEQLNNIRYQVNGIVLGLTIEDTESYNSDVPHKRTESNFSYTDAVYNHEPIRSFKCYIHKDDDNEPIDVKNQLLALRETATPFTVYTNCNDVVECTENVLFESLEFSKSTDTGRGIDVSMTVVPTESNRITTASVSGLRFSETTSKVSADSTKALTSAESAQLAELIKNVPKDELEGHMNAIESAFSSGGASEVQLYVKEAIGIDIFQ